MSEDIREVYKEETENTEENFDAGEPKASGGSSFAEGFEMEETEDEADFEKRVRRRKAKIARRKVRRKILLVILMIALFAGLATMCGRDIIRLKAENRALKKRQQELEAERDKLRQEVQSAGDREDVQDQARKQLRLLNPGELLFTFDEEEKK